MSRCTRFLILIGLLIFKNLYAENIQLTLSQLSIDENVTVTVENNSKEVKVIIEGVYIELNHKKYEFPFKGPVFPKQKKRFHFKVELPSLPGSYILTAAVKYLNEGQIISLKHTALFNFQQKAVLNAVCAPESSTIGKSGSINIKTEKPELWALILPDEIEIVSTSSSSGYKTFRVKASINDLTNKYPYFAVAEEVINGVHYSAIFEGTIGTDTSEDSKKIRGRMSSMLLLYLSILFLITFSFFTLVMPASRIGIAIGKYLSQMFFLTILYYTLKNIDMWLESVLPHIKGDALRSFVQIAVNNFKGSNYEYFFKYFIDIYWGASLILIIPYLYYFDYQKSLEENKYSSLMKSLISIPNILRRKKMYWSSTSKLGMLTICVKFFYIPYLTSWAINNIIHQKNLITSFKFDFLTINAFMMAFFILLDTLIYGFGYIFEFKSLKNEIKSVEPTILGWVVCIWCYPPFNTFSFKIFDYQIVDIAAKYPQWIQTIVPYLVTVLWGVFAWASIALGFKASNLTNRGIVNSGPYRYVRHPAYAAKLMIWFIQGLVLGMYSLGIMGGFLLIYALRAWTEERHLSKDPDYIEYKKKVKWRFIPKII